MGLARFEISCGQTAGPLIIHTHSHQHMEAIIKKNDNSPTSHLTGSQWGGTLSGQSDFRDGQFPCPRPPWRNVSGYKTTFNKNVFIFLVSAKKRPEKSDSSAAS